MTIVEMLPPSVVELNTTARHVGIVSELAKQQVPARGAGVLCMWVRHEGDMPLPIDRLGRREHRM